MKIVYELELQTGNHNEYWQDIEQLVIKHYNIVEKANELAPHMIEVHIRGKENEIQSFFDDLRGRNLNYSYVKRRFYSQKEIQSAPYVLMSVAQPWSSKEKYSESYGTVYTNEECPLCKNGKIQNSKLFVPERKAIQYDICSLVPEIIISEWLEKILADNMCSGYISDDVYDWKTKRKTNLKQLKITNILPPMSVKSGIIEERCPVCHKIYLNNVKEGIIYTEESIKNFKDFNYTYELYIIHKGVSIPRGQCIVSDKVVRLLMEKNIKKLRSIYFEPIIFEK